MKRTFTPLGQENGFTLIELLAVITIILLLAGLILGIAGNAQYKASQSRAQGEIQAMSTAAGNYQIDNGTYPRVTNAGNAPNDTDDLDARSTSYYDPSPTAGTPPVYGVTSQILYQCLGGTYSTDPTTGKLVLYTAQAGVAKPTTYFRFKDNQLLYTSDGKQGSTSIAPDGNALHIAAIADPFGFSYGYSTAYQNDVDKINATPPDPANPTATPSVPTHGFNPTFDLWSTAGYSQTQGKQTPANTLSANVPNLWIKNW